MCLKMFLPSRNFLGWAIMLVSVLVSDGSDKVKGLLYFDDTEGQKLKVDIIGRRSAGFDDVLYVK